MNRRAFLAGLGAVALVAPLRALKAQTVSLENARILDYAYSGKPLPPGDYPFTPPLVLTDTGLRGTPGKTTLRALPGGRELVTLKTPLPGDPGVGLPRRTVLSDLRIVGNGESRMEYGLFLDAACARIERVEAVNCYIGLVVKWAVDVALRDPVFAWNYCNIFIPPIVDGPALTTLRFSGANIRLASHVAVLIQRGLGITFDDRTIIEENRGPGLKVDPVPGIRIADIRCRDVWFEANQPHLVDPYGLVSKENCWME